MNEKKTPFNMTLQDRRAEDEAYLKLIERKMELELKLIEKMPSELIGLFNEYMDVEIEAFMAESEYEYARGFESGMLLMTDTLRDMKE